MHLPDSSKERMPRSGVKRMAKGGNSINLKEGKTTGSTYIYLSLSLLFSNLKTAKLKIGENESATGSRPVWGVTSRPACFPTRRLAVPQNCQRSVSHGHGFGYRLYQG